MKLTDLEPRWVGAGGPGVRQQSDRPCPTCAGTGCDECHQSGKEYEPAPERSGVGVSFRCPCDQHRHSDPRGEDWDDRVFVLFTNPLDGGPQLECTRGWQRTGDTFETLTLRPSILRVGGCAWHGFVTNGEVTTV